MPGAGELNWRIAFQARPPINDGAGNREGNFETRFTLYAKVQARLGGESVQAARLIGQQPVSITVRQSSQSRQIGEDWQAKDARSGTVYAIRSIVDPDGSGAFFEILCQTGTAS